MTRIVRHGSSKFNSVLLIPMNWSANPQKMKNMLFPPVLQQIPPVKKHVSFKTELLSIFSILVTSDHNHDVLMLVRAGIGNGAG